MTGGSWGAKGGYRRPQRLGGEAVGRGRAESRGIGPIWSWGGHCQVGRSLLWAFRGAALVVRMALMDLHGRDWPSSKSKSYDGAWASEFGRASRCGLRFKIPIPVGDGMCLGGTRSPRQVFEPRQTAKKWMRVAGVADETAGPKLAIGTAHPCQAPGQFAFSPDWTLVYRDHPARRRTSSSGPARYYEPIRLCSAVDKNQFHMQWAIR